MSVPPSKPEAVVTDVHLSSSQVQIDMPFEITVATCLTVSLQASGQEYNIPKWIKNNAGWWAEGKIGDSDFTNNVAQLEYHDIKITDIFQVR